MKGTLQMNKYQPLTDHLRNLPFSQYKFSFKEIEKIIQNSLPPSAYQYRAWWSNNPSNSGMTRAWLDAGWLSSDVDLPGQHLVFRRKTPNGDRPTPNPNTNVENLLVENLPQDTIAHLKARAQLTGRTTSQAACDILIQHARLSPAERLAMADILRTQGPQLHHIDLSGMIRADRDSR